MAVDTHPLRAIARPDIKKKNTLGISDSFSYLEEPTDPETQAIIASETNYYNSYFANKQSLVDELYEEIKNRIQLTDTSVPYEQKGYAYWYETNEDSQYSIHYRKQLATGDITCLIDENKLAENEQFFDLGSYEVSPDGQLLAYTIDTTGDERYTLFIQDIKSKTCYTARIGNIAPDLAWSSDSKALYYLNLNAEHRPYQVMRHTLNSLPTNDWVVYTEWDERFFVGVALSKSECFIQIDIASKLTTEVLLLPAEQRNALPQVVLPRKQGIRYYLTDHHDQYYILSNHAHTNFGLYTLPIGIQQNAWEQLTEQLPPQDTVTLDDIDLLAHYFVMTERQQAISRLRVYPIDNPQENYLINHPDPVYSVYTIDNYAPDSDTLRFSYESLQTPRQLIDHCCHDKTEVLLKTDPVLGNFTHNDYQCERIYATTDDGNNIPISLVYHKKTPPSPESPCLLNGYGAYGFSYDVYFSKARLSLLDRGFVVAIAHIRGGGDCGEQWHDMGKLAYKQNSFDDFALCANHLKNAGYTSTEKLVISGGSAGGLLIGAVLNQHPNLCQHAMLAVPFVDMLNTMLNDSLPLTVTEYEEWGDPNDPEVYQRLLSYSPYENIKAQPYPDLYVSCGLHDTRVGYWEALKWVQKLRQTASNIPTAYLKINQHAGHSGASGRFNYLREIAEEYGYLVYEFGLA